MRKLWALKLQIHRFEEEGAQLPDVIGHVITLMLHLYSRVYNYMIVVCLRVYAFVYKVISRLIAEGIIAAAVKPPNGIVSNCDVCGGMNRSFNMDPATATDVCDGIFKSKNITVHGNAIII